jgi:hypothetical protein
MLHHFLEQVEKFPSFQLLILIKNCVGSDPDRVFVPTTTTHHVYDVAAQHVVSGAMEGINGN